MAKSIRSVRGKKMRAIKRVRYNQKQLKQLKVRGITRFC